MKKLIYLLIICLFTSCSSDENKARNMIEDFLKHNLDDYSNYEAISWGKLEKVDSIIKYDWRYESYISSINMHAQSIKDLEPNLNVYKNWKDTLSENYKELIRQKQERTERLKKVQDELTVYIQNYPYISGWTIELTYREPNKVGAQKLHKETFYITEDFSKIVNK